MKTDMLEGESSCPSLKHSSNDSVESFNDGQDDSPSSISVFITSVDSPSSDISSSSSVDVFLILSIFWENSIFTISLGLFLIELYLSKSSVHKNELTDRKFKDMSLMIVDAPSILIDLIGLSLIQILIIRFPYLHLTSSN